MKNRLLIFFAILLIGYLGISLYISSNQKEYLKRVLDSYNRVEGDTRFTLY